MKSKSYRNKVMCVVFAVIVSLCSSAKTNELSVTVVKNRVAEYWEDLCELTDEGMELLNEQKDLPADKWLRRDLKDNQEDICENLVRCKRLLLSKNAEKLLKNLRKIDSKIADVRNDIAEANENKIIYVAEEDDYDKKIKKLEANLIKLEGNRTEIVKQIGNDIKETAGITFEHSQLECFLSMISAEAVLDNAIIAAEMRNILGKLQAIMHVQKSSKSSRRYYGMYLVLIDTQIAAIKDVQMKINKMWIPMVDYQISKASAERDKAATNALSSEFSDIERASFNINKEANNGVVQTAKIYRDMLVQQSVKYEQWVSVLEKRRVLAQNTYDTACVAGDFLALLRDSEKALNLIATIELPDLDMTGNIALVEEFQKITQNMHESNLKKMDFHKE